MVTLVDVGVLMEQRLVHVPESLRLDHVNSIVLCNSA